MQIDKLLDVFYRLSKSDFPRSFYRDKFNQEWNELVLPNLTVNSERSLWNERIYPELDRIFSKTEIPGHRDLQSSNIFIFSEKIYLIDFQDAMLLHPYYDVASLVWDSYILMDNATRLQLGGELLSNRNTDFKRDEFAWVSIQRKLHDLAAFIRAVQNGKVHFEDYVKGTMEMINWLFIFLKKESLAEELWINSPVQKYLS